MKRHYLTGMFSIAILISLLFGLFQPVGMAQAEILNRKNADNAAPNAPALVQPGDDATGVSTSPTLEVAVSDPNGDAMDVTFYGRPVGTGAEDFMIVFIPDPQNESQHDVNMFKSQTNWIVANKTTNNIVYVTAAGDMVNTSSSAAQYNNADSAVDILDAGGVWYTMATGNHDIAMGSTLYANYFGVSRYADYEVADGYWFGGYLNDYNTYSLFSAGGMDFILINLQYNPTPAAITWADELLTTYSDRRAIVEQHDILNVNNSWNNQASYTALRDHDNLFLMLCGHMHSSSDGAAYVAGSGTGGAGQTIHVVLADYQDMNRGNGYLRLLRFSPEDDMIYMTTYSPYTGGSITTDPDQKNLAYDMEPSAPFTVIGTAEDVPSGSNAGITWSGLETYTNYEWYVEVSDGSATTTGSVWGFETGEISNQAPVVTNPGSQTNTENDDVSVQIEADDPDAGDVLTFSAKGLPAGLSIDPATGLISGNLDYTTAGIYTVTVTATDDGAPVMSDSEIFTWNVINFNRSPEVANPGDQSSAEGFTVWVQVMAGDPDLELLAFSATGLPEGLSINPVTGVISGTIGYDTSPNSPYSVTVTASDGDLSDSKSFTWTVTNTNRIPIMKDPDFISNAEGDVVSYQIEAFDLDEQPLTFSAIGLPPGLSIDETTGLISGTLGYETAASSPYSPTIFASDGELFDSDNFIWVVTNTNRAPVVTNPGDRGNAEGDVVSVQITASDPDEQTLTYSATGLPDGLSINPTTGEINGTVAYTAEEHSPFSVTVTASDGELSGSESFVWTISNTNRAPVVTKPENQSHAEGASPTLQVVASDPDGNGLTYSATGLPDGLSINAATGLIGGTIGYEVAAGLPFHVTVTATDNGTPAMSDSETFDWVVTNTNRAPLVTNPGGQGNDEGDVISVQVAATDPDGDGLIYSATGLPGGLSINPATGLISGTINYDAWTGLLYNVEVTVSDGDLSASVTFTWTVLDKTNQVDLSITIDDGNVDLPMGKPVVYTIVVSNGNSREVNGALVVSDLPERVTNVNWTCAASGEAVCGMSIGTGDLSTTVNHLPQNGSVTYTVTGKIGYGTLGALNVTASVTEPELLEDTNPDNNTATDTTVILPALPVTGLNGLFFPLIKK